MRTIAHLSGLQVGTTPQAVLTALSDTLHRLQPDVVAISGNLTASRKASEFSAAKKVLETLPSPQIIVSDDNWETGATPCFADREVIVQGAGPRLSEADRLSIQNALETADPQAVHVLVSFRPPESIVDKFDLVLFGPLPESEQSKVFRLAEKTAFVSWSKRAEGLGINLFRIQGEEFTLERHGWQPENGEFRMLGIEVLHLHPGRRTA